MFKRLLTENIGSSSSRRSDHPAGRAGDVQVGAHLGGHFREDGYRLRVAIKSCVLIESISTQLPALRAKFKVDFFVRSAVRRKKTNSCFSLPVFFSQLAALRISSSRAEIRNYATFSASIDRTLFVSPDRCPYTGIDLDEKRARAKTTKATNLYRLSKVKSISFYIVLGTYSVLLKRENGFCQ